MNDDERFQQIKEKEITRLTTPIDYPKFKGISFNVAPKDCEGNSVPLIRGLWNRYALEPKQGILSDDEILMYAPESKAASRIRLKRGIGTQSDKSAVNDGLVISYVFIILFLVIMGLPVFILGNLIVKAVILLIAIIVIGVYVYVMYIKDYSDPNYKPAQLRCEDENLFEFDDLFLLFESKEKIAREMIEKKFPAPQLTNSKFNAVLDNCRSVVESQIEIINALIPTQKTKVEIDSRKKLIKQLISKVDDLNNELLLSEENDIENAIDDVDELINSVNDYK